MNRVEIEGNEVAEVSGTLFSSIAEHLTRRNAELKQDVEIVELQEESDSHLYMMTETEKEVLEIVKRIDTIQEANPTMTGQKFQSKKGGYVFIVLHETETGVMLKWIGEGPSYKRHVTFEALVKGYTNA